MRDSDLINLYSGRILALAADIPHCGRLPQPGASVRKRAPLCGSSVTVDLVMRDGQITAFAQDVKACALGQASASVLGRSILGRTRAELETARAQLTDMLKAAGPVPAVPFAGFDVLIPARDHLNRHASILLPLEAACEAAALAEAEE